MALNPRPPRTVAQVAHLNATTTNPNPPEAVITAAADLPPAKRISYLLSLPLKELCSEAESEPLRISEDDYILSDYIRAVLRWAICLSLVSCHSDDVDSIPMGYLLGHLESVLASTGALSYSGKPGGALAAKFYHRHSVRKATEAVRRGVPIKSVLQDLSLMDQNIALRSANEAVAAREKKNKSWRNWSNYNSGGGSSNSHSSNNNKRSRGKAWDKNPKAKDSSENNNNNNNDSNDSSKKKAKHFRSILLEDSAADEPRLYYTSPKIDAAKLRNYNLTGGALEHLVWARQRVNPLQTEPTLPHSLLAAIRVHKELGSEEINDSREKVMRFLKRRAQQLTPQAEEMRSRMPADVHAISGRLNLPLLRELILLTDYPDTNLAADLQNGMPVVGRLPYVKGVFGERQPRKDCKQAMFTDPEELLDSSMKGMDKFLRQIEGQTFSRPIWDSCLAEVKQGQMEGPLTPEEAASRYGRYVLATRFAVEQVDKRFCDDFRRSGTNRSTEYSQAITLPGHETILAAWRMIATVKEGDPIKIFKSDHESAYRQVPTNPEHSRFQLIGITGPEGKPAIFRHRALSFGASSSVWSYCRISQCLTHLHRILFAGVSMSFIDDYWGIEPESTASSSFDSWVLLNNLIGFREKEAKRQAPTASTTLLGLKVSFKETSVSLGLTVDKRQKLITSLEEIKRTGRASTGDLKKLCGRLTFAAATSADHSWRAYTRTLYSWIFQGNKPASPRSRTPYRTSFP
ncbi:hypothetical protein FOZ60_008454 [Perkinsus olseni]|uniref:Uncharacterized protein n=1 Tax=Perkinsus olseni TaxID=32597 RepID=A0A7J6PEY3_PEROL|nr:hypothetical protein FOZ60_008454 [Perkinsus olseni]